MVWPFWFAFAALVGSIPFGWLVARSKGVDVRAVGSGNIGATNVARAVGKRLGLLVLALDAAKGAAAVLLVVAVVVEPAPDVVLLHAQLFGAGLAVLGHCFTPWLGFRGGKGVATSLGVLLVVEPLAVALSALVFALTWVRSRKVALGSLAAVASLPFVLLALGRDAVTLGFAAALVGLIVVQHRDNLARLRRGTEPRFE